MKKFEITYKNLNICFGGNVFTKIFEGRTAEEALAEYGREKGYILNLIEAKEVQ